MKIAIVLTGETRVWEQQPSTVVPAVSVPSKYKEFIENIQHYPELKVDFYGITWDHCKLTKDLDIFTKIKKLNFENNFKNDINDILQKTIDNFDCTSTYAENLYAQPYICFSGLKFANEHGDYDLIIKLRWDVYPHSNLIENILKIKNTIYKNTPILAVCNLSISYDNNDVDFITTDWIWAVNKPHMKQYIECNSVHDIIHRNTETSYFNTGPTDINLGFFSNELLKSKKLLLTSSFDVNNIQRVIDGGMINNWLSISDTEKNEKKVGRLPT